MNVDSPAVTPLRDWIPGTRDLLIGGEFASPRGERWPVYNPATEEVIATVGGASAEQVDAAVAAARAAFAGWDGLPGDERSRHPHRLADVLGQAADELLPSIVNEVGTPVSLAAFLQVRMAVEYHLRWAADAAKVDRTQHLGPWSDPVPTMSDVVLEPAGVVAAITGYSYPLNLALFKFRAALAAGSTGALLAPPRPPRPPPSPGAQTRPAERPP